MLMITQDRLHDLHYRVNICIDMYIKKLWLLFASILIGIADAL